MRRPAQTRRTARQHIGAVIIGWVVLVLTILAICAAHNIIHNSP